MDQFRINYIAEAYMGQKVDLYCKEIDGTWFVCGKTGNKTVFDASIQWK